MKATLKVRGLNKLSRKLKNNRSLADVREVVKMNTIELERLAKKNAKFVKTGKSTGTTKRSINLSISNGGMTGKVQPNTEYSPYLEHGTRFMEAQPFMKPSYQVQKLKFVRDMRRLFK